MAVKNNKPELELEKRLSAAAWRETLARLTVGLAHDFNNLLAGILAPAEVMLAQAGPNDPNRPMLEAIKQRSLQSSELMKRIVLLHRSETGNRDYLDFNQAVAELAELARKALPRRIEIETAQPPGQLPVYMDPVQFRQVGLNLAFHAADAMPDRGYLGLRVTAHTTAQELRWHCGQFPRLPCVCLSVKDNGAGIPAEVMSRLFEPFATTEPPAKGPALGLYGARLFIEGHGGAISVESNEGKGTTFCLWLPQADL